MFHRGEAYLLHEFVLMPDHLHLLITPTVALERAMQLIKGGFSYRAKKELGTNAEIWQRGFADHRIRDAEDYDRHVPRDSVEPLVGTAKAVPFQSLGSALTVAGEIAPGTAEAVSFQNSGMHWRSSKRSLPPARLKPCHFKT
jgi:hypothetical protein